MEHGESIRNARRRYHPPACTCYQCVELGLRPPVRPTTSIQTSRANRAPNLGNGNGGAESKNGCIIASIVAILVILVVVILYILPRDPEIQEQIDQVVKTPTATSAPTIPVTPTLTPTATPISTATPIPTPMPTATQTLGEEFSLLENKFKQWRSDWLLELGRLPHVIEGKYASVTTVNLPVCGVVTTSKLFDLETRNYINLGDQEIILPGEHQLLGKTNKPGLVIKVPLIELDLPTLAPWRSSNTEYISELKQFLNQCDDKSIN